MLLLPHLYSLLSLYLLRHSKVSSCLLYSHSFPSPLPPFSSHLYSPLSHLCPSSSPTFLFAHFHLLATHFLSFSLLTSPLPASLSLHSKVYVGGVYRADKWQMTIAGGAGDKAAKTRDAIYQSSHSRAKHHPAEERGSEGGCGKRNSSPSSDTGGTP